jgi:hypothetical protein
MKVAHRSSKNHIVKLNWVDNVFNLETYKEQNIFRFLNIENQFSSTVDWNFSAHKKLWTYNLNYFDFLNQESMTREIGLILIQDFISQYTFLKDGKEPYPTSLRIINWIKFIAKHEINDESINCKLKEDANRLYDSLEYHLLANHLLENGFALWFAAHLFDDSYYFKKASKILKTQLNEQILEDGGHFELSPMYHNLMLYRVLDCIQLRVLNPSKNSQDLLSFLREKASAMLNWSKQMTFESGAMPLFNDTANGNNPDPFVVMTYAEKLKVNKLHLPLKDSGYRTFKNENYELIADVGQVGPSYQPGHAHADTFNFELYVGGSPVIVDTGTSTYNIGEQRSYERSTKAHNTVVVNQINSSQVWSGFRVAKRAGVSIIEDSAACLKATHNGYKHLGVLHQRQWVIKENQIVISDILTKGAGVAYFHFHPNVFIEEIPGQTFVISKKASFSFNGAQTITKSSYNFAPEFNTYQKAIVLEVAFEKYLETQIVLN